jgi:uncharacterized protein
MNQAFQLLPVKAVWIALVALCGCAHASTEAPSGIIDMHCHTAGIGGGDSGCFVSDAMMSSYKFGRYLESFGVTREQLEREGDQVVIANIAARVAESRHVSRAVVLALDGVVDPSGELDRVATEVYVPNEFVAREVAKHPNLLWGASVNPLRHDALARLHWAAEHGAVLVKWLPSIQHVDPSDPRLVEFYRALADLKMPLLTHTGTEHSFTDAKDELCDPERLRLPLELGVTIIAAHAGTAGKYNGERSFERLARMMIRHPNLYADISSLTQLNKIGHLRETLGRPEFTGRLIYGTDYPLTNMPILVSPWYHSGHLTAGQLKALLETKNPWDRDVMLKQALGVPADVYVRAESILKLSAP